MNYSFSTRFIRALIKSSLESPLTTLRMLLKATGSTVSHTAGLATLQSCFYELDYTGHKVRFALAKQQHHSRQMNSKKPLVIKATPTNQNAKPKDLGFPLSQDVRICPRSKRLPVPSIIALCLSPFCPLQLPDNTPPPKITTPMSRSRLSRSGSVSAFQFISHQASSHPLPAGFAAHSWITSTTSDRPGAESLGRKPSVWLPEQTLLCGHQQAHTWKDECQHSWDDKQTTKDKHLTSASQQTCSFLTNTRKAFIWNVNKAEVEQKDTGVWRFLNHKDVAWCLAQISILSITGTINHLLFTIIN